MDTALASELNCSRTPSTASANATARARDFTLNSIRDALVETVACFPIYRTYIGLAGWSREDRAAVDRRFAARAGAIPRSRRRSSSSCVRSCCREAWTSR